MPSTVPRVHRQGDRGERCARAPVSNVEILRGDRIVTRNYVNLGFAVELADSKGLIISSAGKHCEGLNLLGMARAVSEIAARARDKKLMPDQVQGATFTITNPGGYGTFHGTPVISQPQAEILGTDAVVEAALVIQDELGQDVIAIRPMLTRPRTTTAWSTARSQADSCATCARGSRAGAKATMTSSRMSQPSRRPRRSAASFGPLGYWATTARRRPGESLGGAVREVPVRPEDLEACPGNAAVTVKGAVRALNPRPRSLPARRGAAVLARGRGLAGATPEHDPAAWNTGRRSRRDGAPRKGSCTSPRAPRSRSSRPTAAQVDFPWAGSAPSAIRSSTASGTAEAACATAAPPRRR